MVKAPKIAKSFSWAFFFVFTIINYYFFMFIHFTWLEVYLGIKKLEN